MFDIKNYEPLWGAWQVGDIIGEGSFGKVYKIWREDFGTTYTSAVKIISIPQDESEPRRMKMECHDDAALRCFYQSVVESIASEIELMNGFRGNSHIVSIMDHMIIDKTDPAYFPYPTAQPGWDILIRMELLKSLPAHVIEAPLTVAEIVKLGVHICRALELCALKNIIHRDIKQENIFVSAYGEYKLGDFGVARQIDRTMSGLSRKGTYTTMAPEVFHGEQYGANVDTYGLGIVMYTLLNQNRAPFLPAFPQQIMPADRDNAMRRRVNGEPIPEIKGAGPELNALVLQACAYNRKDRFASPAVMRKALEAIAVAEGYDLEIQRIEDNTAHQPDDDQTLHLLPNTSSTLTQNEITQQEMDSGRGPGVADDSLIGKAVENVSPPKESAPLMTTKPDIKQPDTAPQNPQTRKKMIPILMAAAITAAMAVAATFFVLMLRNPVPEVIAYVQGYGIRVNDEVDIILSDREEAQEVLDEFTAYYTNQAAAEGYVVTLVTYEEEVEIVETETLSSEIKNKQEAMESLNEGSIQTAYFIATEMTTVPDIAQKYKVTEDSILAENVGLTLERPLEEGTQVKLAIIQPRISVILEGTRVITEEIDFETETKEDPGLLRGKTEEKDGEKGIKSISHTFVSRNGIIVKDTVIEEAVMKEPVKKIVIIGTKLFTSLKDAVAALPEEDAVRFIWQTLDGRWYFTKGNGNAFKITYMEFSRDKPGTIIMVDDSGTYVVELKEAVKYDDD
ncbi:MAG: protein kinase, partial [Peptococcaceae bacterium]|nr:protein kinase [Peptococcaceae bacterium]